MLNWRSVCWVLTHLRFDMHVRTCQPTFSVTFGEPAAFLHRILLVQVYILIAKPSTLVHCRLKCSTRSLTRC
jgi:hypothetical protein